MYGEHGVVHCVSGVYRSGRHCVLSVPSLVSSNAPTNTHTYRTPYSAAQRNILAIVEGIAQKERVGVRFGLVCYRDHPPQEATYVTRVFQFTTDVAQMKAYVDTMAAVGGGDGPEAVADALFEVLHMEWRPSAAKVCVLIADAPPHGLGEACDGFPQGAYTLDLTGRRSMNVQIGRGPSIPFHTNQSIRVLKQNKQAAPPATTP